MSFRIKLIGLLCMLVSVSVGEGLFIQSLASQQKQESEAKPFLTPRRTMSARCFIPLSSPLTVRGTVYQAVAAQCDANPQETFDGSWIAHPATAQGYRWLAISHDLRRHYQFGDTVLVQGWGELDGPYVVHDLMNKRYRRRIDVLVGYRLPLYQVVSFRIFKVGTKVVSWKH